MALSKHTIQKKKNIVWTEFPQSRRAAEKGGNKDSALGKLLLRKKKAKNIVRVKRETRPRLWELGNNKNSVLGKSPLQEDSTN